MSGRVGAEKERKVGLREDPTIQPRMEIKRDSWTVINKSKIKVKAYVSVICKASTRLSQMGNVTMRDKRIKEETE